MTGEGGELLDLLGAFGVFTVFYSGVVLSVVDLPNVIVVLWDLSEVRAVCIPMLDLSVADVGEMLLFRQRRGEVTLVCRLTK